MRPSLFEEAQNPEALRRGMNTWIWSVEKSYEIILDEQVGRVIQPRDTGRDHFDHFYLPMAHPRLPIELARVKEGDETAALRFVSRYGLLCYPPYPTRYHLVFGSGDSEIITRQSSISGDPLEFVWLHARQIRWVLRLAMAFQKDDTDKLMSIMEEIMSPKAWASYPHFAPRREQLNGKAWRLFGQAGSGVVYWQRGRTATSPYEQVVGFNALRVIQLVTSFNLEGVHPGTDIRLKDVSAESAGHRYGLQDLRREFRWRHLLEVVYWHLWQQVIEGSNPLAICRQCGHFFIQQDGRQRFCPPPERHVLEAAIGIRKRVQSLCAQRFRMNELTKRTETRKVKRMRKGHGTN
jgi:hypothetical protein